MYPCVTYKLLQPRGGVTGKLSFDHTSETFLVSSFVKLYIKLEIVGSDKKRATTSTKGNQESQT